MKPLFNTLLCCILLLTLASCGDDEKIEDYPSAITELIELSTNSSKAVVSIRNDRNEAFSVTNDALKADIADTTYRCLCTYEKINAASVKIYQVAAVISMHPKHKDKFITLPKDPVHIISQWRTDRYINLMIRFMTVGAENHGFGLCEDKVVTESDGTQTVYVLLLHKKPAADKEAYSEKVYVSVPTFEYAKTYDNIVFTIPTYDGNVEYKYALK